MSKKIDEMTQDEIKALQSRISTLVPEIIFDYCRTHPEQAEYIKAQLLTVPGAVEL